MSGVKYITAICFIALIAIAPVNASIIDDLYQSLFGEQNPQVLKWNNESCKYGEATFAIDPNGRCNINYNIEGVLPKTGLIIELGAFDSAGYIMPIWSGDILSKTGKYNVNLITDLQQQSIATSDYYVRIINTPKRGI